MIGFERLREEYDSPDLRKIYVTLRDGPIREMYSFLLQDGYLFRFRKLCIPRTSLRDFLSWEAHAGGLAGHFGQNKSIEAVEHRFYWPSLKRDVAKIVNVARANWPSNKSKSLGLTLPSRYPIARGKT